MSASVFGFRASGTPWRSGGAAGDSRRLAGGRCSNGAAAQRERCGAAPGSLWSAPFGSESRLARDGMLVRGGLKRVAITCEPAVQRVEPAGFRRQRFLRRKDPAGPAGANPTQLIVGWPSWKEMLYLLYFQKVIDAELVKF